MTDDRGAAGIAPQHLRDDDWSYVPPAMRPIRARGLLAGLVILIAAGLVLTLALTPYL